MRAVYKNRCIVSTKLSRFVYALVSLQCRTIVTIFLVLIQPQSHGVTRIFLSALIITRNRPDWLERCVRSLGRAWQKDGNTGLRILVFVNGPDPESVSRLEALRPEWGALLDIRHSGRALSPAEARNRLLASVEASSDWIYFVDDDAFVPESHFANFRTALEKFPSAAAIGGPNLAPESTGKFQRASDVVFTSFAGTFHSHVRYAPRGGEARPCSEASLILCNLFVRRDQLGSRPFPERFVCAEENALLHELHARGLELIYSPMLFNWHERRPDLRQLLQQAYNYGRGRGQFIHRHPDGFRIPHVVPGCAVIYSAYAVVRLAMTGSVPASWSALLLLYAAVSGFAGAASKEGPWWGATLFPLVHSAYGIGVFHGLIFDRTRATAA